MIKATPATSSAERCDVAKARVSYFFSPVRFPVGSRPAPYGLSRRRSLGLNIRLARPADNAGRQWSAGYGATEAIGYAEW